MQKQWLAAIFHEHVWFDQIYPLIPDFSGCGVEIAGIGTVAYGFCCSLLSATTE